MLEETFRIPDSFSLEATGFRSVHTGQVTGDFPNGGGLGFAEATVNVMDPEIVVQSLLPRLLDQFVEVGARSSGSVLRLIHLQELGLNRVPVVPVNVGILQGGPPDQGFAPEDHVQLLASAILVPVRNSSGGLDAVDQ